MWRGGRTLSGATGEAKTKAAVPWRSGLRFLRDFAGYAGRKGIWAALLAGAHALLDNIGLALLVPFLSLAIREDAGGSFATELAAPVFAAFGAQSRLARLVVLAGVFTLLLALRAMASSARSRVLAGLRTGFAENHRMRILRGLAGASWDRVPGLRHARVTQVLTGDIERLNAASFLLIEGGVALFMLGTQLLLAFALSPPLAAAGLAILGLAALAFLPMLRRGYALGGALSRDQFALVHSVGQFLGGLKLAISQNLQESFVAEFEAAGASLRRQQIQFQLQQINAQLALSSLFGLAGCLWALAGLGLMDQPAPLVFTLLVIFARIGGPAQAIAQSVQQLAHALPAYEHVLALHTELAQAPPPAVMSGAAPASLDGPIRFHGVTYMHGGELPCGGAAAGGVRGLSLEIEPSEFLGITGHSGAGKTTFADLLTGLIAPQAGEITIGGVPLRGAAVRAWRDRIAYVAQDCFLFHDTLRRNLLWARPGASDEDIWHVLALTGASNLVRSAPAGLDTAVGERGTFLSGGERQRIALARALLRRPRLLVLDEATSAMDIDSERQVLQRLRELDPAPTIALIAHRRESLQFCGRVLTFTGHRLGEQPLPALNGLDRRSEINGPRTLA